MDETVNFEVKKSGRLKQSGKWGGMKEIKRWVLDH